MLSSVHIIITFDDISFCCISKWNWSDKYSVSGRIQKCGEGGKGAWVLGQLEPGLERGRTFGAEAREESERRGPEFGRWSRSRGPREEGCSKEYEHEEEEGLKRTWHKLIHVMYMQRLRRQRWNGLEKERLWGAINSEFLISVRWTGPAVVPPPLTVTATDSTTGLQPLMQRVPRAPPDVASSRLMTRHGLCALVCVCVMSEAWPGLWNIIYLVAPGFMLTLCSSVAVVKTDYNSELNEIWLWCAYDVAWERASPWVDHTECMSANMPCVIAVGLHARMCEWGVPVVISNKTPTSNSKDRSFPRHVTHTYIYI